MKYIVMQVDVTKTIAREDIITFPDDLVHFNMTELMKHSYLKSNGSASKVVSAGFVNLMTFECYGESESLNIKSRNGKDSTLLMGGQYGFNIVEKEE
jgi:hypothetical protein